MLAFANFLWRLGQILNKRSVCVIKIRPEVYRAYEMAKMWTVVKFTDENTVEAVPSKWIVNNKCYWPPFTKEKLIAAIKKNEDPNTCWPLHEIIPMRNSSYDDYLVARKKCKKAEDTSDLNSDVELNSRRIIRTRKFSSSSSSDETQSLLLIKNPPKLPNCGKRTLTENIVSEDLLAGGQRIATENRISSQDRTKDMDCTCCPIHGCSKIDQYFEEMIRKLSFLRVQVKQIGDDINNIQQRITLGTTYSTDEVSTSSLFHKFNLPLKTVEELTTLEEHLLEEVNFNMAVKELSKIGGNSTYDFVRRCLTLIITNELAEEYSWHGLRKKREFGKLQFANVMIKSSDINNKATNKETEEAIKKWLRRAKERKEGKKNKD